jgi:hypothetical protein
MAGEEGGEREGGEYKKDKNKQNKKSDGEGFTLAHNFAPVHDQLVHRPSHGGSIQQIITLRKVSHKIKRRGGSV